MPEARKFEQFAGAGGFAAMLLGLYCSSLHSYLLFHSLVELVTIAVAYSMFILAWNTRRYLANNYLLVVGIGYAFISFIDLLHALAYKGMGVFPGDNANLPTQLWIAARYLQAATLLIAPLMLNRQVDRRTVFAGYVVVVAVLVALISNGRFPDCYLEGKGLTGFKVGSEYLITALLLASLYPLYKNREHFQERIFFFVVASLACTALSEISFTAYVSVYGFANLVGHFAKLAAFYFVYQAILVTGLREPYALLSENLKAAQQDLAKSRDKLAEQVRQRTSELRISEEKYRTMIECANDAVFINEIQADGMPGPFLEVNELACRRLGYSRDELTRMSPMELDDPRYCDRIREAMEALKRDGHVIFETAQVTKDGRSLPVEVSTRLLEGQGRRVLFSLVRDLTERKLGEAALLASHEALRKREAELNEAQRLAHIGSWEWDAVHDTIWWSAEYYRIYEIDPSLTPPNYQEHLKAYTPESAARLDAAVQKSMASGEPYEVDLELAQPTVATRWIVARGEVKKDAAGKVIGLRGTAQNITEQKLAEAKITAFNEELEKRVARRTEDLRGKSRELQESQLALMNIVEDLNDKSRELEEANANLQGLDRLKSMFIASMSHELRTPLNSIIGFSSVILEEWLGPLNAEQKGKLAIVLRTGKHLLTLINDVIDVSKIEAGKLESRIEDFELGQVVAEALELVRKDGEEKGLRFRDATTPLTLHSDRRRFFQCLVNLLGNAVKFSTQGEVTVVSTLVPGTGSRPDCLRISVRDCGIGIPKAELPRLFTAFTRIPSELSGSVKGTGLGLYLVKKITQEILQGEVGVESTPGQGSIFSLTVPLHIKERSPAETASR